MGFFLLDRKHVDERVPVVVVCNRSESADVRTGIKRRGLGWNLPSLQFLSSPLLDLLSLFLLEVVVDEGCRESRPVPFRNGAYVQTLKPKSLVRPDLNKRIL